MQPGTIVEFTNKTAKYYVRVDQWCGPCLTFCGGIESNLWFVEDGVSDYYRGTFGFFNMEDCSNIQVCHDEDILNRFVE